MKIEIGNRNKNGNGGGNRNRNGSVVVAQPPSISHHPTSAIVSAIKKGLLESF